MAYTAKERRKLRGKIKEHFGWAQYRADNQVNTSDLDTSEKIAEVCAALGINVPAVLADAFGDDAWGGGKCTAEAWDNAASVENTAGGEVVSSEDMELLRLLKRREGEGKVNRGEVEDIARAVVKNELIGYEPDVKRVHFTVTQDERTYEAAEGSHQHELFGALMKVSCVRDKNGNRPNIMIFGPKSSGKSFSARMLAETLGLDFAAHNAVTWPEELLGSVHPVSGEYNETNLIRIYRNGGVILLDENDRSENSALLPCNGLLADGEVWLPNGELVKRHADCIIVCTANTKGTGPDREYVGANKLDAAYLSRFAIKLQWEIDTALEKAIVGDPETHKRLMKLRNDFVLKGVEFEIDTRVVQSVCDMVNQGFGYKEALGLTVVPMLEKDQVVFLKEENIL